MHELIDCHIHTQACGHAEGTVAQMVEAAVARGLTSIVLTEHLPLPHDLNEGGDFAPSPDAFLRYAEEVRELAASTSLNIILGAEADWMPHRPEDMELQEEVAGSAGVDVVLGSVHFIDDWPFDSPSHLDGWDTRGVDEVWVRYFELWRAAARSGRFDVMAHPDLVKKFGHRPSFDLDDLYMEAAKAAAAGGLLIEVSTAGLRKPVGEMYPSAQLLSAFRVAGVAATVGSDAHAPDEVGYELKGAYEALSRAGYTEVAFPVRHGKVRWIAL